jgi:hypothetical protein
MRRAVPFTALVGLGLVVACVGSDPNTAGGDPEAGKEGGPCIDGVSCIAGLECRSGRCVTPGSGGDDGATDAPNNCAAGETACTNGCTSLAGDKDNCGRCGRSCSGGECVTGVCTPAVLAIGQGLPRRVAVHGENVYWTNAAPMGGVRTTTKNGGMTNKVQDLENARGLTLSTDGVAFYTSYQIGGVLWRYVLGTGDAPTAIGSGQDFAPEVVVDGTNVYWSNGTSIQKKDSNGLGTPTTVAGGQSSPHGLAVVGGDVFWVTNDSFSGGLWRTSVGGGTVEQLTSTTAARAVAAHAGIVYYAGLSVNWKVVAYDTATKIDKAIAVDQGLVEGVAADASGVYWTRTDEGEVVHLAPGATTPVPIAKGFDKPFAIALDAGFVYFTTEGDGRILKLAKP